MSSELSWDHVAFLFYTTKGVVSAVGQGSRTAARVKEFTLQYITDTFASWIINQGGFVSVPVSSHALQQKASTHLSLLTIQLHLGIYSSTQCQIVGNVHVY